MAPKSQGKIFVNLCVKDLKATMAFWTKLGFEFNPQFTDDNAACMVIGPDAFAMLLGEPFFKTFTKKEIANTATHTEGMFALAYGSREEVDAVMKIVLEAGGRAVMPPTDHGFMYGASFYDLDGHHWEPFWMDPKGPPKQ